MKSIVAVLTSTCMLVACATQPGESNSASQRGHSRGPFGFREQVLEMARGKMKPERIDPSSFNYGKGLSLGGPWESGTFESIARHQRDGSYANTTVRCERTRRGWSCTKYDNRWIHVFTAGGEEVKAMLGDEIEVQVAEHLARYALQISGAPVPSGERCPPPQDEQDPQDWSKVRESLHTGSVVEMFIGASQPNGLWISVDHPGDGMIELRFTNVRNSSQTPTFECWNYSNFNVVE